MQVGDKVHLAVAGSALVLSNQKAGLERVLDLYVNGRLESLSEQPGPADAARLLPPGALGSLWVNLVPAQQSPEGKEIFKRPKGDPGQANNGRGKNDAGQRDKMVMRSDKRQRSKGKRAISTTDIQNRIPPQRCGHFAKWHHDSEPNVPT